MVWGTRSLESSAETRECHLHPSTCRWHFPPFQWNDFQLSLLSFIYTFQTLFMATHSISCHSRYSSYYNKEEKSKEVECSHTKMVWYVFYRDLVALLGTFSWRFNRLAQIYPLSQVSRERKNSLRWEEFKIADSNIWPKKFKITEFKITKCR